jgi:hypothetical protein
MMSDDTDPDSKDIDSLLREDATQSHTTDRGHSTNSGSLLDNTPPAPAKQTQINRLLARSAHVSSNLRQAFTSIRDTQNMVDIDRDACTQLTTELGNLDQLIIELEKICASMVSTAADKPDQRSPAKPEDLTENPDPRALLVAELAEQYSKIHALKSELKQLEESISKDSSANDADTSGQNSTPAAETSASQGLNRLIIATTDQGNLKFPLHKHIMTIGRAPQNDIHIRSRFISRYHARIVCDEGGAIIEDLDSSNGIAVNSHRARRQPLRSGDLIDLGKTQLKYIDLTEGSSGEGQA